MKRKIIIFIMAGTIVIGSLYHFFTIITLKERIKSLKHQMTVLLKIERDTANADSEYYQKLAARCISIMDTGELIELAKQEWNYKVLINGKEFKGSSVKIEGKDINIEVIEVRERYSILPEETRLKGQLKNFPSNFKAESNVAPEITNKDNEYDTHVYYKFKGLSSGDSVKLIFSDELKNRIGLPAAKYTIYIN